MRNVKVNVQADTSNAVGKVRELTGALARLDAVTRRNVQYLLQTLSGAGLNPAVIGAVQNQQAATAQAQSQVQANKGATAGTGASSDPQKQSDKNNDTIKKLNEGMAAMADKQLGTFIESFAKAITDAFTKLGTGKFKEALTGLKTSLQGLFGELLGQLVGEIAAMLKKSLIKNLKDIFSTSKSGGKTTTGGTAVGSIAGSFSSGRGFTGFGSSLNFGGAQSGSFGQNGFSNSFGGQTGNGFFGTPGTGTSFNTGTNSGFNFTPNRFFPDRRAEFARNYPALASLGIDPFTAGRIGTNTFGTGEGGGNATPGADVAGNTAKAATSFSWGSFGKMVGSMAPAMGSSFGGMLGGSSTTGSILGSVGGLIGGTAISALLSGSLTGASTGGIFTSIGTSLFGAGAGVGLATAGIGLAIAAAFMVGAYFLGKNKQRKADEKTRNQAMLDAFSQLDDILKQVNRDEIDGKSAVSQAGGIRKQYMDQMSQLKDKKTRNIALKDVSRIDAKISLIKQAADNQSARKALDAKLVPTFADGGLVGAGQHYKVLGGDGASMQPFRGRVPGIYDRRDDFLARLTGNEVVLTPDVWMPIAPYLKQKKVPGFANGGMIDTSGVTASNQMPLNQGIIIEELVIHLNNQFGSETAAKIVDVGLKTQGGQQAVVKSVRTHIGENGLGDGLVRDINRVNSRGF